MRSILITGGAGFIGSNLVSHIYNKGSQKIINLDKLTYAGNLESLIDLKDCDRYAFIKGDICDRPFLKDLLKEYQPSAIIHLAAESHVDRSIDGPGDFIRTNIVGTFELLEAARDYWGGLNIHERKRFRFLHISTDEVFGSLAEGGFFTEDTCYQPNSPYSASKASSDHLVRAYFHTYGLPTVISNCSNNYGPKQFPEKLIPLMILNALDEKELPIYGKGDNIRDWLYVEDHCRALYTILELGKPGEVYCIGGNCEKTNLEVVEHIINILDCLRPRSNGKSYSDLITFVKDRPGHDFRYAIDSDKIVNELGWAPRETFESGLQKTVEWYLSNLDWCNNVLDGKYMRERLGFNTK